MKIDGTAIAAELYESLTDEVEKLKARGVLPTMVVLLVGQDAGSLSYIKQKQKAGEKIGARVIFRQFPAHHPLVQINTAIQEYNEDPSVHGFIIQRPVPGIPLDKLTPVALPKDVDGFVPGSSFVVPVAAATLSILQKVSQHKDQHAFAIWLKKQQVVVLGRGDTAGKPIAQALEKLRSIPVVIHSKTPKPQALLKAADIIISCVGKPHVITGEMIKPGVVLISVGVWRDAAGKIHGDYDAEDIEGVASWYTPTPGGVGPVNVACLMQNLVTAAEKANR